MRAELIPILRLFFRDDLILCCSMNISAVTPSIMIYSEVRWLSG